MNTTRLPPSQTRILGITAAVGLLLLTAGAVAGHDRAWASLCVGMYYLLTLALGAAVLIALLYVTGAGWHVAFRRVPEAMAAAIPFAGAALLLVMTMGIARYGWYHHGHGDAGTFWFKEFWLTPLAWWVRSLSYVVLWSVAARWIVACSQAQDRTGAMALTHRNVRLSALFLAVYAVTFSLASVDWVMALEPMWFSTIWGVYHFAGMIQATLAAIIVLALILRLPGGPLQSVFNDEHLHDLGKLLLGFSCFWMYIWYCQYMLIWYSNIPEETSYFITRTHGAWGPVVILSIILNWVIPFFGLLPRSAKRSGSVMVKIAVVVLVGRWVDLYVMVFPAITGEGPRFGIWEVAAIVCSAGAAALLFSRLFEASEPVPKRDPYLPESLHYDT